MSEYVTLVSNVKLASQYGGNTIAEFRTQLGHKFSLVGDWVVGVVEVSYTKSWYNVLFPHKITLTNWGTFMIMRTLSKLMTY
jgi:hypothetical protein